MKHLRRFAAISLCLTIVGAVPAIAVGLSPIREFQDSGLTDVPEDWSREYIAACYELGLMSGQGSGSFNPAGTVSVAEGLMVAARIHDLWRGGKGEISGGEPWYAGAVAYGLEHGLLSDGEFADYTAPATRAQLAGILARTLPRDDLKAINNVETIPDVNETTPYSQSIFMLYNAGILSGSDAYGTIAPDTPITRAELAAILCRLVQPDTRLSFTLQEKPAGPAMAYTADKLLWVGNVPLAGLVVIEGEYYFPLELLNDNGLNYRLPLDYSENGEEYSLYHSSRQTSESVTLMAPTIAVPAGREIGEAQESEKPLKIKDEKIYHAIRTLGGRYPMVRLSAVAEEFGYREDETGILICTGDVAELSVTWEGDLPGQAAASLVKDTPRATAQAFHDYLVNTLTHMDGMDKAYWQKNDPNRHERGDELCDQYKIANNYHLAWGYGVCQNYAEIFKAMCVQAGIPCQVVSGQPDHAWNRVYVDGQWLYVDVTWDDPTTSSPTMRQDYFLVGPEVMVKGHWWDDEDYPMPKEYDPAWEQLDPNNITSADMFRKCLVAQIAQKKTSFSLRTTVKGAYGGNGCIYAYPLGWWSMSGGYNSKTNTYDYTFEY